MVHYIDKSLHPKNQKGFTESSENESLKRGFLASKFVEFCTRTDLHGYKYIVMKDLNLFERSCWALAVLVSTACAVFFVVTAYKWYARNPIVTVIESTQGAIWDIPFPAVTICNLNVISRAAAREFADNVTLPANVTRDDVFEATRLAPLLHSSFPAAPAQKRLLHMLQTVLEMNSVTMESFFKRLSPASFCSKLVQRCIWKNTIYRCDDLFEQVFTYFAVCCSFNFFAIDGTNTKMSASAEAVGSIRDAPRRIASCGYQTALTVLLDTRPDDYFSSNIASQGALVFIDNAYNIPDIDSPVRLVNPATEVLIALSPERTYTTPGIRAFPPDERQCFYSDEVKVGNFRQYSFHNCQSYQRVEHIKNVCDCIPHYFPLKGYLRDECYQWPHEQRKILGNMKRRDDFWDYHRTCTFSDIECLEGFFGLNQNNTVSTNQESSFPCLPECEHYDYPLEVALGKLAKNLRLDELPFFSDVRLDNHSLVNVFFNDLVSTRYRRDVYLNWQNLLASFGGLLSLMLGFTLISGFDLLLFFTFGLAFGSIISHHSHDNEQKTDTNRPRKNSTIYVQEYNKNIDIFMKKKHNYKDNSKWHSEVQFGIHSSHNRY